jgi:uncharacterized protein involved in exopolysaccharide biosynthesis
MTPTLDLRSLLTRGWERRRFVVTVVLGTMLLTLGISFAIPRWYKSTAVILPPEESDLLSNMSLAQRALTKFPVFGILDDYFTPADIFKAVLQSRTLQEDLITSFELLSVYKKKSMEKAVKELKTHYEVELNPDGTISVSVEDTNQERAARMANHILETLDRYNVEKRNTQARRTRLFLERRVAETESLLTESEKTLQAYQETHYTVTPASLQSVDVQSAATLMARKIELEVRLGVLRGYLRDDNQQVVQVRNELAQLKARIASLPVLQTRLVQLIRDQKVQEQLYLLLTAELEQSRIRETMDTPTVQILDPAVPAERHSKPRRLILMLAAGLLAFVGAMVFIAMDRSAGPLRVP